MQLVDIKIANIQNIGYTTPRFTDPNPRFKDSTCTCPAQFIPCIENSDTHLEATNIGGYHDRCMLAFSIPGHTEEGAVVPIGEPFPMDDGETLYFTITIHWGPDYWTETKNIVLNFHIGYEIDAEHMHVTDTVSFNTQIYVENGGNGNGGPCEGRSQAECTAPCHWYARYFWEAPSCHTAEQNMMMDYLPFIIAGVGGAIIIVALVTRPTPASS